MRTAPRHYPIVIIGSGPTGLTLANLLGGEGVPVLLVERNAQTVQEPRAVSIDDESLRTMQAAGVIDEVLAGIVPGYGSHYYSPHGLRFAKVEPTGEPYGYPRRNAFRQPVLEAQLRTALGRFAQVDTLFGWRMVSFSQSPSGVLVELSGPDGEALQVSADYLVGCDGAGSSVREQLGISLTGTTFQERWLIVDLENVRNPVRHTEVFCNRRRPCITLPGPNGTRRYEFKLHGHERDEDLLAPASVERLLRDHRADPEARIVRKTVYRFHARVAPAWAVGRVFLAGDAAHLTPPFAGQGMNSGIRDAHNLAWKLAAVVRGTAGSTLLATYEAERRDHVWEMIELALRMGRVMSPRTYWSGWLTQTFFLALNIWPPARDYVAQMKYKPKPRFKAGFMLADGKSVRETLVGRLFPQPRVVHDGTPRQLDQVIGNRFALVAFTDRAGTLFQRLDQPLWDRLGCVRLAIRTDGARAAAPGVMEVTVPDGSLEPIVGQYRDRVLLLRPDHYVAAALSLDAIEQDARAIEALLGTPEPATGMSNRTSRPRQAGATRVA